MYRSLYVTYKATLTYLWRHRQYTYFITVANKATPKLKNWLSLTFRRTIPGAPFAQKCRQEIHVKQDGKLRVCLYFSSSRHDMSLCTRVLAFSPLTVRSLSSSLHHTHVGLKMVGCEEQEISTGCMWRHNEIRHAPSQCSIEPHPHVSRTLGEVQRDAR